MGKRQLPWLLLLPLAGCRPASDVSEKSIPAEIESVTKANEVHLRREVPPIFAEETTELRVDFPLENTSKETVSFANVRKSCGCTDAELAKKSLAPGETTNLSVALRTPGRFGAQSVTCFVEETSGKTWVCELNTVIHQRFRFDSQIVHYGLVRPRSSHSKSVTFIACSPREAELPESAKFEINHSQLKLGEVRSSVEKSNGNLFLKRFVAPVELIVPSQFGAGQATLTVEATGKKFTMNLDWFSPESFVVAPQQAFFAVNETAASKQILIRRRDGGPLQTLTATSPHPSVAVAVAMEADLARLTVTFDRNSNKDFLHGEIVVATGDADQPTLRIPVAVGR